MIQKTCPFCGQKHPPAAWIPAEPGAGEPGGDLWIVDGDGRCDHAARVARTRHDGGECEIVEPGQPFLV